MIADPRAFILANTRLQSPPHVPELNLYLADEITPIWRLTEDVLAEIGLPPPFWAFAWAGGQALARYVLDHRACVSGQSVVDFAAGSGLVGIAALKAGAADVLCADTDRFCGAAVALNGEANGVRPAYTLANLLLADPPAVGVILAGDVCYERAMAAEVRAWLKQASAEGTHVLIGDPGRTYFPRTDLVQLAEYQVETTTELEDYTVKRTGVWTFP